MERSIYFLNDERTEAICLMLGDVFYLAYHEDGTSTRLPLGSQELPEPLSDLEIVPPPSSSLKRHPGGAPFRYSLTIGGGFLWGGAPVAGFRPYTGSPAASIVRLRSGSRPIATMAAPVPRSSHSMGTASASGPNTSMPTGMPTEPIIVITPKTRPR